MDTKHIIVVAVIILGIVGLNVWWQVYKYQDCKNVGHSTFYCIMSIGK